MRIVYKGTRSGKTRVAIITYSDNEKNAAYDIAIKIRNATSYKVDTGVDGMLIVDVDDMNDYNNFKEWYKEFKETSTDNKTNNNEVSDTNNGNITDNETVTDSADGNDNETVTDNETIDRLQQSERLTGIKIMKYNVKKIESTNTMTTTLTTSCKKRDTAISRFCRFLSEYDSCFKDSLLIATAKIYYAGDAECCLYKADIDTDEYIMTYTEYTPMSENTNNNVVFTLIIEFKHDENNTNDNETSTDSANSNETPVELKAEINNKYGVNAVYYDTDSILCDFEKQIVNVSCNTSNITPQPCHIKAYYDGKELTVPYSEYKCKEHAIEYIKALYENRVVSYETLFILYYGKHVEPITIEMVFDTPDLLQYNIDDINVGLKTGYYKKVREGVERFCALIDDKHVCGVGFKYIKHTFDYTITKSKISGCYNVKRGNNNLIQKPSEIARILYYHTFAHVVILKYWHTI